ncbi:MAG: hypothetical protein ACI854_002451 [Arenicella sp.]|jgi:hypothetical protein
MFSLVEKIKSRRGLWSCLLLCLMASIGLSSCATKPVSSSATENICKLFQEKPNWYRHAKVSVDKWGGNIHVPMAVMYQESSFKSDARPPMAYLLGFIPQGRASDAYGYSQALKSTWGEYEKAIGKRSADRDNFADAFDFILWYMDVSQKRNGVSKWDAYAQYLNYHEGQGGYARGSYKSKQWLLNVAKKVQTRSKRYSSQLAQCKAELDSAKKGWF